ncbi:MAG: RNA methyltransferase [Methanoregulaceae archaeon]
MKVIAELSGEHPGLPFAELGLVGEILDRRPQVAVVDCKSPGNLSRLSLTHAVSEYLGECEADSRAFARLLKDLALCTGGTYAARVKKMEGCTMTEPAPELERLMGSLIEGRVRLENPDTEYRAVCSGERWYLGRLILRIDRGSFGRRRPGDRAFFHPGVMMPRMARALVNISLVQAGEILLDPFCGTGGMVLEAELVGAQGAGSDIDPLMVAGSRKNVPGGFFFRADATALPVRSSGIHAVATDLPYGQSVSIAAGSIDTLYSGTLEEIRRVLMPGRRAVVVTHRDISRQAGELMEVVATYSQRVHRSLVRRILVLRK